METFVIVSGLILLLRCEVAYRSSSFEVDLRELAQSDTRTVRRSNLCRSVSSVEIVSGSADRVGEGTRDAAKRLRSREEKARSISADTLFPPQRRLGKTDEGR